MDEHCVTNIHTTEAVARLLQKVAVKRSAHAASRRAPEYAADDAGQPDEPKRRYRLAAAALNRCLGDHQNGLCCSSLRTRVMHDFAIGFGECLDRIGQQIDRKSTRLNSRHVAISYAAFR